MWKASELIYLHSCVASAYFASLLLFPCCVSSSGGNRLFYKKKKKNLSSQQSRGLDSAFIIPDGSFVSERGVKCNLVVLAAFNHSLYVIPKLS